MLNVVWVVCSTFTHGAICMQDGAVYGSKGLCEFGGLGAVTAIYSGKERWKGDWLGTDCVTIAVKNTK